MEISTGDWVLIGVIAVGIHALIFAFLVFMIKYFANMKDKRN